MFFLSQMMGLPFGEALLITIAYVIAIVVAMVAHEYAHCYTAYKMGDATPKAYGRLTLNPLKHFDAMGLLCFVVFGFGWAKPVPINSLNFRNHKKGTILVSLSGILTNLVLGFVFACFYVMVAAWMPESTFQFFLLHLFFYLMALNIMLAIFNMLPIYPLDGFNFLNAFMRYDNKFVDFNMRYGPLLLLMVLFVAYFTGAFNYVLDGVEWLFTKFWAMIFGV